MLTLCCVAFFNTCSYTLFMHLYGYPWSWVVISIQSPCFLQLLRFSLWQSPVVFPLCWKYFEISSLPFLYGCEFLGLLLFVFNIMFSITIIIINNYYPPSFYISTTAVFCMLGHHGTVHGFVQRKNAWLVWGLSNCVVTNLWLNACCRQNFIG